MNRNDAKRNHSFNTNFMFKKQTDKITLYNVTDYTLKASLKQLLAYTAKELVTAYEYIVVTFSPARPFFFT